MERMRSGSLASVRPMDSGHEAQHGHDSQQHAQHHKPYRPSQPEAIVSLLPAGTEVLYALGLGTRYARAYSSC